MKTKFQISIIILGVIVAIFCLLSLSPMKLPAYHEGNLSQTSTLEEPHILNTLFQIKSTSIKY